jgi:hypothetical protein
LAWLNSSIREAPGKPGAFSLPRNGVVSL